MPGEAVETRNGQAALTSLVGTENRRLELAIGEPLYFLERESALAADRPQTTTHKLVICRHGYLLHTTERTALNALSSSVPNITACVQQLRPKRLRNKARSGHGRHRHLRSRGPNGPPRSGRSGKNGAPQIRRDPVTVAVAICGAVARAAP